MDTKSDIKRDDKDDVSPVAIHFRTRVCLNYKEKISVEERLDDFRMFPIIACGKMNKEERLSLEEKVTFIFVHNKYRIFNSIEIE